MKNELLLKVAFACMACDGSIDKTEIDCIKSIFANQVCDKLDMSEVLNKYVLELNLNSSLFFQSLFDEIGKAELTAQDDIKLISIAIQVIEADNIIDYNEIKLLKKMRSFLKITDKELLCALPEKEDYILPDVTNNFDIFDTFNANVNINISDLTKIGIAE